jgi:PAS domain S-box-containing protein
LSGKGHAGRILYLNSQAVRMFGYERSEMVDQSIEMLVPENVRERQIFPVLCASFCRR